MAADFSRKPPYGAASRHPDGMMYPASSNIPMAALLDGASYTVLLMETIDDQNSRWVVGSECTLVGLPQASSPTGDKPQEPNNYFTPPGYWTEQKGDFHHSNVRSFLSYDFSPQGADAGKYEDPGWAKGPPAYGPSSMHPGVVAVGMCDGSVMAT